MATPEEVEREVAGTGNHHAQVMYENGPHPHTAFSVQDKVSHASREATLYLPNRTLKDPVLRDYIQRPGVKAETVLGHAIAAGSLARVNYEILVRLARHLNVDISDIQ